MGLHIGWHTKLKFDSVKYILLRVAILGMLAMNIFITVILELLVMTSYIGKTCSNIVSLLSMLYFEAYFS